MYRNRHKYTHDYFMEQLIKHHSEKYTFDKVKFTGAGNKIIVTCNIHGDFETYASSFLNNEEFSGCAKCRMEKRSEQKAIKLQNKPEDPTQVNKKLNSLIKVSSRNNFNLYDYSETIYSGVEEIINVICPAHGAFEAPTDKHKKGQYPCPVCKTNRTKHGKLFADNEFRRLVEEKKAAAIS